MVQWVRILLYVRGLRIPEFVVHKKSRAQHHQAFKFFSRLKYLDLEVSGSDKWWRTQPQSPLGLQRYRIRRKQKYLSYHQPRISESLRNQDQFLTLIFVLLSWVYVPIAYFIKLCFHFNNVMVYLKF